MGATAHVLAALHNGLLYLFRQARWTSMPDALAHYGAAVVRAFGVAWPATANVAQS